MTPADADALRARLSALQANALRQLAEADTLDAGLPSVVADTSAALAALDIKVKQRHARTGSASDYKGVPPSGEPIGGQKVC